MSAQSAVGFRAVHDYVLFMANTGLRPDEANALEFRHVEIVEDKATGENILLISVRGKRGVGYCKSMANAVRQLLIPDIKGEAHIVYESGQLYPHHNLYYITSDEWDLQALQAVLLSGIARLFVSIYSTKMRGGYLRFQAQYLPRIRVPCWGAVSVELKSALIEAAGAEKIQPPITRQCSGSTG